MPPLRVARVASPGGLETFVELGYRLRGNEHFWVPPPRRELYAILDRRKDHPFHEHAAMELFVAFRGQEPVGRIAAIENHAHNIHHREKCGHFGFFEAANDPAVFRALYAAAEKWCAARGLDTLRGPCNPSTNEEVGFLAQGFDSDPAFLTPYTPPYYLAHTEAAGFAKAMDLFSFYNNKEAFSDRIPAMARRIREKLESRGVRVNVRPIDMKRFDREVEHILAVYNEAWSENWGFVPMTPREVHRMATDLKPIAIPDMILFAEVDAKVVGVLIGLPDYNVVLKHLGGRLGPREVLLFFLLRRNIHRIRLMGMGVVKEYRVRGIETILIAEFAANCIRLGYPEGEFGWVLETNKLMNRGILANGAHLTKIHRIYEKPLARG
ncbi:MAG: N-acetyltransferase [Candidatus Sumerlaeia bacterium]|nr:N-acetyltransferase [Candidatus Sumerlaeia bacterium]